MARASRSSASSRVSKSLPKRRTRKYLSIVHEQSSDEDEAGIPPAAPPKRSKPAQPPLGRLTRSQRAAAVDVDFKEIPAVKKRRTTKARDNPPKRQRTVAKVDNQESESGAEDGEEDESAPQTPEFYKKINNVVLPERDQTQVRDEDVEEPEGPVVDQEAELHDGRSEGEGLQTEPVGSSQAKPPKSGRRLSRRQQRQKTPFGETVLNNPEGSPELGSHFMESPSKPRDPVARSPQGNPPDKRWYDPNEEDPSSSAAEPETPNSPAPDASAQVVLEDPVDTEPTSKTEIEKTEVSGEWVGKLIKKMKYGGWTDDRNWEIDFTVPEGGSKPVWLKRHEKFLRPEKCKELFKYLDHLRELCHDMPKATNIEAHIEYQLEKEEAFRKSFAVIDSLVNHIWTKISAQILPPKDPKAKWGQSAAETLHKRIIPMLILVLRETFVAGGALMIDSGTKSESNEACFTLSTLALPLKVMVWLHRLYEIGTVYSDEFPPKPVSDSKSDADKVESAIKRRQKLITPLSYMRNALEQAKARLEYLASAPQRKKEAMAKQQQISKEIKERQRQNRQKLERQQQEERKRRIEEGKGAMEIDQVLREERERREEEERQAQDQQMQLFLGSIQRMNGSEANPRDAYFDKHGGWYQWEDERLLQMIRTVERPDLQALAPLVPGRSVDELAQRVRDLKERIRLKYERMEMVPPMWCYQLA
ncbi:hypothetical protein AK830_g12364 [Neonectria ditissima]|uniref:Myb-like domain-containing protein n=1 Tax=Neonectria ditissima TaxID=78410 RepID=A0A0P7APN7_9HYPO|nr:hypothetical protein AK830_g12364 [Neonectria ditissima]